MKISSILSKIASFISRFKRAKKSAAQPAAPAAAPQPAARVRVRNASALSSKPAVEQPGKKAALAKEKPAKKSFFSKKRISFRIPSINLGFRLDPRKLIGSFTDLVLRSALKKEIEGFYGRKNYRAVLLSISSDRTEENFLAVKKELKAQDILISRFPGKIMKSRKLQGRRSIVESELNKLEIELSSKNGQARRQGSDLKSRISELDSQVSVFREIRKLAK